MCPLRSSLIQDLYWLTAVLVGHLAPADHVHNWPGLRDGFHVEVIRAQLTRKLAAVFGGIRDEIVHAFEDNVPVKDDNGQWSTQITQSSI